jgi:hypothetical protein
MAEGSTLRDLGVTTITSAGGPLIIEFRGPSDQLYTPWAQLIIFWLRKLF